jgi:hypothetical protein
MKITSQLPELPISANRGWLSAEFRATAIDFANTSEVLAWLERLDAKTVMASDD